MDDLDRNDTLIEAFFETVVIFLVMIQKQKVEISKSTKNNLKFSHVVKKSEINM